MVEQVFHLAPGSVVVASGLVGVRIEADLRSGEAGSAVAVAGAPVERKAEVDMTGLPVEAQRIVAGRELLDRVHLLLAVEDKSYRQPVVGFRDIQTCLPVFKADMG